MFPPGPLGPAETVPGVSPKPSSLDSKRGPKELDHETSAQAGPGLASLVPSSGSEGISDYEDFSCPSPPLTGGRNTNKERREKESA